MIKYLGSKTPAINSWRQACRARAFELEVAKAHKAGKLQPAPIYLSVGQGHVPAIIAGCLKDPAQWHVFPQHRGHSWYIAFGGDPAALRDELLGRETGCAAGMGGSASLQIFPGRMYGHSGLLGDQAPIAAGLALATNEPTIVVLGDAAVEEDYVLATLGFAVTKRLPVLFVVEDNGLSILTKTCVRRSWDITKVARGFGMWVDDCADELGQISGALYGVANRVSQDHEDGHGPMLLNIRVCRHLWHAGSGNDGPPERDGHAILRAHFKAHFDNVDAIEAEADKEMADLWSII